MIILIVFNRTGLNGPFYTADLTTKSLQMNVNRVLVQPQGAASRLKAAALVHVSKITVSAVRLCLSREDVTFARTS